MEGFVSKEKCKAAFLEEQTALCIYLSDAEEVVKEKSAELSARRIPSAQSFDTDAFSQEIPAAYASMQRLDSDIVAIRITLDSPYFKRFDVGHDGETQVIYVGSQPANFGKHIVSQWQQAGEKPMLDFLMQGSGELFYTDMNGDVHERIRERSIDIRRQELIDVSEDFVSDSEYARLGINDPFLINVIKRRRAEGIEISNIISTIQRNQYDIIRYPADQSFVVQGCAGSGKTYILFNRLSYLLFNKKATHLAPEDVIVISPNPRIQYLLSNVIVDLNIEAVRHIRIEDWYLEILQRYSLRFDNSLIMPESSLPIDYENAVFSEEFQRDVLSAIRRERDRLYAIATELADNPEVLSWGQVHGVSPTSDKHPTAKIAYIRSIGREARLVDKIYRDFCEENEITEDSLNTISATDETPDMLLSEISDIDAQVSAILKYEPLFEEYQTASELLDEENKSFDRHRDEVRSRLQASLERIHDLDTMTPEERTSFLTRHLHLESDSASFEEGGTAAVLHKEQILECHDMMDAAWAAILSRLPEVYRTTPETAQADMHRDCALLLEMRESLQERLRTTTSDASRQRANQRRALELRSALLPEEFVKKVSACARQTANLPLRARDVTAALLRELKHKYNIQIVESKVSVSNDAGDGQQKRVLYRSDLYMFLFAAVMISEQNSFLGWRLICFDEAQDISISEYTFIQTLAGKKTCFNIFGDILQGRAGCSGTMQNWQSAFPTYPVFQLNENYRNAQQITKKINQVFSTEMLAIGVDGSVEAPRYAYKQVFSRYISSKSKGWIIVRDRETFFNFLSSMEPEAREYSFSFDLENADGTIVVLTIDQIKGLEFPKVLVITKGMDMNQKYIAMTRALSELYIL
jgi:DNA helicase IV